MLTLSLSAGSAGVAVVCLVGAVLAAVASRAIFRLVFSHTFSGRRNGCTYIYILAGGASHVKTLKKS